MASISYPKRKCPECAATFQPRRHDQVFCATACNTRAMNREMVRARTLYRALYWWRYGRLAQAKARVRPGEVAANLRFICQAIAAWVAEDQAAGRGPPPKHAHGEDRGHQRQAA